MYDRIAFVKTGWSESYAGDPVVGRHSHISEFEEAHERFNFRATESGSYFAYLPPIGKSQSPPQPKIRDGWLVIFVAAHKGRGKLTVVGWYKNAAFEAKYEHRPEYASGKEFATDVDGNKYSYCLSSNDATLIPVEKRSLTISGDHFKRAPIIYAKGNGSSDGWRSEFARLALKIINELSVKPEVGRPNWSFPDAAHRKKVEEAAIAAAGKFLRSKGYKVTDRQKDNCGYDLLAKRSRDPGELHVEVKGTGGKAQRFFLTRNEYVYMRHPKWRLLLVTEALSDPRTEMMDSERVKVKFELEPLAWEAAEK